jgi:alpha-beta hydrolase superfamily lysophospholipase
MLGVAVDVPIYKDIAALVFSKLLPTLTLDNEIKYESLTSDEAVLQEFRTDVLRHHKISSEAYLGALVFIERLRQDISHIKSPTLVQIPKNDPVIDSESTRQFFKKLNISTKKLIEYSDRKHEIYNDIGRQIVFQDIISFLKKFE